MQSSEIPLRLVYLNGKNAAEGEDEISILKVTS